MTNLGKDFYGSSYVWFTGIIENVHDPLGVGRVQVRILGVHSQDKVDLPTEKLPWAQVIIPTNGAFTFSSPKVGDWVDGFFQDGHSAQIPVVRGVYSGLWKDTTVTDTTVTLNKFSEFSKTTNPSGVYERKDGEPINPPTSRNQVEGTMIAKTNDDLAKACDIVPQFLTVSGWIKFDFSVILQKIRNGIRAIIKALGADPTGIIATTVSWLKKLNEFIRNINDIIKEALEYKKLILEVAKRIKAIIDYIMSLPAKFLKFLQDCLKYFLGGVQSFLKNALSISVEVVGGELGDIEGLDGINDLVSEVGTTIKSVGELTGSVADIATIPLQTLEVLVNPSSPEDLVRAEQDISSFVTTFSQQQSDPKYFEDRTFNLENTP